MPSHPNRPAAVVFDLDGTLVDTVEARIEAWLRVFAEKAIPARRSDVAPLIGSDGRRLARDIAERADRRLDDAEIEEIDRRSGEIFDELNRRPRPLAGVAEALAVLERDGIPWAIATSSRRDQVGTSVNALALEREPLIVDGSHVEHAKPAPDLLLRAAQELGVHAADCWYIGDSTWDMRAAAAAGMRAIGVTTGSADAGMLTDAGADDVLDSLEGLVPLLQAA